MAKGTLLAIEIKEYFNGITEGKNRNRIATDEILISLATEESLRREALVMLKFLRRVHEENSDG